MESQTYRGILKRVGAVLVVIGLIDIAVMIYCIVNRISYSSSFNIFSVIAGMLLMRGGLKTAVAVRWFVTIMLSSFVTLLLAWPIIQPLGLTITQIRLNAGGFTAGMAFIALVLGLLFWVIRELGREPIRAARDATGLKRRDMRLPLALGIGFVVVGGIVVHVFLGGESGERAKSMAEKEVGPGYTLHVSSLRIVESQRAKSVSGVVTAWNDKEIREIPVHWEESRN
jgi:hypothetical protein